MDGELPIFVYGTLKRGECYAHLLQPWAERVEAATVPGQLYDLGPFPALVEGSDSVRGELVWVPLGDGQEVLARLDRLEEYDPHDPERSLYRRVKAEAVSEGGERVPCWLYVYQPEAPGALPLWRRLPGEWREGV